MNEFGTRNLHNFATSVRRVQSAAGNPGFWGQDAGRFRFVNFEEIASRVRQGNFLVLAVHSTDEDPDVNRSGTLDSLRLDCKSRGYVWSEEAQQCDWSRYEPGTEKSQTDDGLDFEGGDDGLDFEGGDEPVANQDTGLGLVEENTSALDPSAKGPYVQAPDQDRGHLPNHAILVTGAYDDNSLQVYTTWTHELQRWKKDMSVGAGRWMINPIIAEEVPLLAYQDRSKAQDLLASLNAKYAYTGSQASAGCPGTGGDSTVARGGDGTYDPSGSAPQTFSFQAEEFTQNGARFVKVSGISGCPGQPVSWVISSTAYDESLDPIAQTVAHARWQTAPNAVSFQYPFDRQINRYQVTGACKNKTPYSVVVLGYSDSVGVR